MNMAPASLTPLIPQRVSLYLRLKKVRWLLSPGIWQSGQPRGCCHLYKKVLKPLSQILVFILRANLGQMIWMPKIGYINVVMKQIASISRLQAPQPHVLLEEVVDCLDWSVTRSVCLSSFCFCVCVLHGRVRVVSVDGSSPWTLRWQPCFCLSLIKGIEYSYLVRYWEVERSKHSIGCSLPY